MQHTVIAIVNRFYLCTLPKHYKHWWLEVACLLSNVVSQKLHIQHTLSVGSRQEQVINSKQWANQHSQFSSHSCSSAAAPLLVRCVQQRKDLRKILWESMSVICEGLSLSVTVSMVTGHYNHYLYILVPHFLGVNIFFEHTSIKITCRSLSDTPVEKGKACFWSHSLAAYVRVFRTGKCYFTYLYTRWFTGSLNLICSSKQLKSAVHHVESMFCGGNTGAELIFLLSFASSWSHD